MLFPLILICGAAGSAAVVAYGTDPDLAEFAHGISIIILCRRLEWPMVATSLLLCGVLLALTISGRYRIWWLIGLGPVLALFVRGFAASYHPSTALLDAPRFVSAGEADVQPIAGEYVVGFMFGGRPYALPYGALANSPLVLISAFDKRALAIWSMTANCAKVLPLDRDTRPHEIEVVSRPADSLLLFDSRLGQFIVGVTGRTVSGETPVGFGAPLSVQKLPEPEWIALHPDTQIMITDGNYTAASAAPLLPIVHFPQQPGGPTANAQIAIIATTQPMAVLSDVALNQPLNTASGETRILLDRGPKTNTLRAFDRHLKEDLFLTLKPVQRSSRKHPDAVMIDSESASLWTLDGRAVDGPLKGERLREIPLDAGLYWGVMKFWLPNLKLLDAK